MFAATALLLLIFVGNAAIHIRSGAILHLLITAIGQRHYRRAVAELDLFGLPVRDVGAAIRLSGLRRAVLIRRGIRVVLVIVILLLLGLPALQKISPVGCFLLATALAAGSRVTDPGLTKAGLGRPKLTTKQLISLPILNGFWLIAPLATLGLTVICAAIRAEFDGRSALAWAVLLGLGVLLTVAVNAVDRSFRRRSTRRRAVLADRTPGDAILLLRSFDHDSAKISSPLGTPSVLAFALPRRQRFEEFLAVVVRSRLGGLVAFGQPGERRPLLGANRAYFAHSAWQEALQDTVIRSRGVLVNFGTTASLRWELETLDRLGALDKTLFVHNSRMTPGSEWREVVNLIRGYGVKDSPAVANLLPSYIIAFSISSGRELCVYYSDVNDWAAYVGALTLFDRHLDGTLVDASPQDRFAAWAEEAEGASGAAMQSLAAKMRKELTPDRFAE